jgi:hypothetical protein
MEYLKNDSGCTLNQFYEIVARAAELIEILHAGIGADLCQQLASISTNNHKNPKGNEYGQ